MLAERLGVGERQLRRLFEQHLGASPIAVAQTRRVLFAKQLLARPRCRWPRSRSQPASAAAPLQRGVPDSLSPPTGQFRRGDADAGSALTLTLPVAPPYDWPAVLATLKTCGDHVDDGVWRRAVAIGGAHGDVEVRLHPSHPAALSATIRFPDVAALTHIVRRIRRVFDLSADPLVISAQLANNPLLAPLVRCRLGLRVPGTWDDPSRARSASEDAGRARCVRSQG